MHKEIESIVAEYTSSNVVSTTIASQTYFKELSTASMNVSQPAVLPHGESPATRQSWGAGPIARKEVLTKMGWQPELSSSRWRGEWQGRQPEVARSRPRCDSATLMSNMWACRAVNL